MVNADSQRLQALANFEKLVRPQSPTTKEEAMSEATYTLDASMFAREVAMVWAQSNAHLANPADFGREAIEVYRAAAEAFSEKKDS